MPNALRSVESQCHPEYLEVLPATGLLSWLVLLWLVQRQPHTSLDPLQILPHQLWLGGRVLNARVKSDLTFLTTLAFACCFLHNNCKMIGEQMARGWLRENPVETPAPSHQQQFTYLPRGTVWLLVKESRAILFWESFIAVVCNLKVYICRIQEINLICS